MWTNYPAVEAAGVELDVLEDDESDFFDESLLLDEPLAEELLSDESPADDAVAPGRDEDDPPRESLR